MTSIIQVMNTRGVAFATDSAVSYGEHSRNSAQKLFSLSGRQPIAFMTMGCGIFAPAGLSWDRIFYKYNLYYSEKYGSEAELDTIEEYEKDFIGFLETLVSVEANEKALKMDIWNNWATPNGFLVTGGYYNTPDESQPNEGEEIDQDSLERRGLDSIQRLLDDWSNNAAWMSEESHNDIEFQYKVEQIGKHHGDSLREATEAIMMEGLSMGNIPQAGTLEEIKESVPKIISAEIELVTENFYLMLRRWLAANGNSHHWKLNGSKADVIFGGFGKIEDFPRTTHIITGSRVSGLGNSADLLLCRNIVDPNYSVPDFNRESGEYKCSTFLEALAQNEFIMRMTTGLADVFSAPGTGLKSFAQDALQGWLHTIAPEEIGEAEGVSEELAKSVVSHLEEINMPRNFGDYFESWIHSQQVAVKSDFRQAVHRLGPVELAEFASDLIAVQAKIHNIVFSQASVDLPVDVCYLSKENGFIWHSRKNMPDLELNPRLRSMDWKGSQID